MIRTSFMRARPATVITVLAVGLSCAQPVTAEIVTMLHGDVLSSSGAYAGTVDLYMSFGDLSWSSADLNADSSVGLYALPSWTNMTIANWMSNGSNFWRWGQVLTVQTGDNGAVVPGYDTFRLTGIQSTHEITIDWSGPISTFSGDGIPNFYTLAAMNGVISFRNTSTNQLELQANVRSMDFFTLPVPASAWLLVSGLGLFAGLGRRKIGKF